MSSVHICVRNYQLSIIFALVLKIISIYKAKKLKSKNIERFRHRVIFTYPEDDLVVFKTFGAFTF